jgi:hypothetical protein
VACLALLPIDLEDIIMNWNKLVAAGFFAVLNVAAFSAHADVQTHRSHLDIKKVISTV